MMLRKLLSVRAPTPLGRWQIGGDWERRADLATIDSGVHTKVNSRRFYVREDQLFAVAVADASVRKTCGYVSTETE